MHTRTLFGFRRKEGINSKYVCLLSFFFQQNCFVILSFIGLHTQNRLSTRVKILSLYFMVSFSISSQKLIFKNF